MDRKEFLRASLGVSAVCAASAPLLRGEEAKAAPLTPCEEKADFARVWIKRFMDNVDEQIAPAQRVRLMEARGRSCARGGAVKAAQACGGDVDKLVATFVSWNGPEAARREGRVVYVSYPKCFCPMVGDVTEKISETYCRCSAGWLKEMFETASGKPVEVEILETVKRGGKSCRFAVRLEA